MPSLWQTENFGRGLHTKPARTEGGELYAADIENLQVDNNGHLKLRVNFGDAGTRRDPHHITGIAAAFGYIFTLRSGGKLWLEHIDGVTIDPKPVEGIENDLRGRISIVAPGKGFVVLTSEGPDQGYWIALEGPQTEGFGIAHPLGISSPPTLHKDLMISLDPPDEASDETSDETSDMTSDETSRRDFSPNWLYGSRRVWLCFYVVETGAKRTVPRYGEQPFVDIETTDTVTG